MATPSHPPIINYNVETFYGIFVETFHEPSLPVPVEIPLFKRIAQIGAIFPCDNGTINKTTNV